MSSRSGPVHVVTTSRTYKGRTYKTHLLRRSFREGDKVKNETVGNISHLPQPIIELIRRSLAGQVFICPEDHFDVVASRTHGHVQAALAAVKRLELESLISATSCRECDLVVAMVVARILESQSKLATTRWWHTTTLPDLLEITDADEDELYRAMDWLLLRQDRIEKKLAKRHLQDGGLVLFDLTSSYFEGTKCPIAAFGHNRDGKKGKLQVNYGLLTDGRGCPVSVSVFPGNTSDTKTLLPEVTKVQKHFGIRSLVLVGDRGMISQRQIDELRERDGIQWITALRGESIHKLLEDGRVQAELFDEKSLFELTHPDFPGERLIACRNPELAWRREQKRKSLLEATEKELAKVARMVEHSRLRGKDLIGVRVGRAVNKYMVAKHFDLRIEETAFEFKINRERVAEEAALDGLYVIRTSVSEDELCAEDAVRNYKALSSVERAFRSFKTIDLKVRPIRHWNEDRVRSHILLCMLAFYVQWHMQEAWRPLLFTDEDQEAKKQRDPVAPATRSKKALEKVRSRTLDDGTKVHSFRTLIAELGTIVRNTCRTKGAAAGVQTFELFTTTTPSQRTALELLETIEA